VETGSIFSKLLGSGYLPKELPPTFSSRSLGDCAERYDRSETPLDGVDKQARLWRQYEVHNLARAGTLRRELAIVNPIPYWRLVRAVASAWTALKTAAEESPISLIRPIEGLPRNLITGRDLPAARATARSKGKFVLQADISNFYGSIYTHTIPWALHGKTEARAALGGGKAGEALLGDTLDKLCRAMQDGQSVGLPVGPDVSLLLAEVILSKVDASVLAMCAGKGLRFIDDYELVFDSESRAIEIRTALQSALAEFRLTLNPLKTEIHRLPVGLDNGWSRELWRMISRKPALQRGVIVDYFDRAFELAQSRPAAGVLKFALGKLSTKAFSSDAESLAEDLVLQCGRVEAGCLPHMLVILLRRKTHRDGWSETLTEAFDSVVREHAPQRHSSEVAWALWACLGFKLELSDVAAQAVMQMEDSVCSLLLYQAHLNGLLEPGSNFDVWKTSLGADDLRGPRWLLAYELTRLGFTLDATGANYVTRDPLFSFLLKEGVGFFDGSRVGTVPPGLLPIENGDEDDGEEEDDKTDDYSEGGFWDEWGWDDDDEERAEEEEEDPTKKGSIPKHLRKLFEDMKRTTLAAPPAPPKAPPSGPTTPGTE